MLRKNKKQPQTVGEKVNQLLAHPNDSDTEEESDVSTSARLADFELEEYDLPDARSTEFRKRNVKLLSEQNDKYKGKITSRMELEEDELSYEESDSNDEDALEAFNKKIKSTKKDTQKFGDSEDEINSEYEEEKEDEEAEENEDEEESGDEDGIEEDDSDEEEDKTDAINPSDIMSKTNHQAEMQKGICVQNQLRIWERLLELRINTQKFTSKANQLPLPDTLKAYSSAPDHKEDLEAVLTEAQKRSSKLLHQLLALQSALTQQNPEHRQAVKRKSLSNDSELPIKRLSSILEDNFKQSLNYRNEVLLKWDDRTKLLTPGAGFKRKSLHDDYDIIKKINSALANRQMLVEKSQIPKNSNQVDMQDAQEPQRQPHIYDDSDFYHQQLRELIEYKASSSSNMSDITKQFVELQKLRQKMKKKVDTRASKGRKLRYVVHNKLINFMAPNEASDWTESSKSELYKSLFV